MVEAWVTGQKVWMRKNDEDYMLNILYGETWKLKKRSHEKLMKSYHPCSLQSYTHLYISITVLVYQSIQFIQNNWGLIKLEYLLFNSIPFSHILIFFLFYLMQRKYFNAENFPSKNRGYTHSFNTYFTFQKLLRKYSFSKSTLCFSSNKYLIMVYNKKNSFSYIE